MLTVDVVNDFDVDVVGDHRVGRILIHDQVTGEGSQEVVGLERLCREGGRAGEKVSETHIEENIEAVRCSTFGRLLSNNLL